LIAIYNLFIVSIFWLSKTHVKVSKSYEPVFNYNKNMDKIVFDKILIFSDERGYVVE